MRYRLMYCKTLNPLGETGQFDFDSAYQVIFFLRSMRNKDWERTTAGYSVYEIAEDGGLGKTLLNWQQNGVNIFGRITCSERPELFFSA